VLESAVWYANKHVAARRVLSDEAVPSFVGEIGHPAFKERMRLAEGELGMFARFTRKMLDRTHRTLGGSQNA